MTTTSALGGQLAGSDRTVRVAVHVLVVMVAFAAINVMHAFNHVLDRDLGGRPSDPYVIGVQALLAGAGAVLSAHQLRAQQRRADGREAVHR